MGQSLAVKYRPKTFEDGFCGQSSTIKILKQQLQTHKISNCYLFCGPSGTGKTTIARAFANAINNNKGNPIEIDAASNNGVDAVRDIIASAKERSIESEYKIFIIDEVHALSNAAWQAFLKCIEEPPEYTIFMFCTTNPEKIPETIQNRVMRLNLSKVDLTQIKNRLLYICEKECYENYVESCDYIAKISCGGVRDAISCLEKCANYSSNLSIENVLSCLGGFSYDAMFNLTGAILNQDEGEVLNIVSDYYNSGNDLKVFMDQYLDFAIDLTKYCIYKDIEMVKIPQSLEARCLGYSQIPDISDYNVKLIDYLLKIKITVKNDTNCKTTIEAMLVCLCRDRV